MKTRTLILLAMACGLAILVAGGVFLWRVIVNKDELTVPDASAVGQSQQVGPVEATVTFSVAQGDQVEVEVHLESVEPIDDAGAGWALLVDGKLQPQATVATATAPPCAGAPVDAGVPFDCSLAFHAGDGQRFLAYAVGSQQRLWKL